MTPKEDITQGVDPFEVSRVAAMLVGYHERWIGSHLETVAVEVEFRAPLVDPQTGAVSAVLQLGGKLDVIAYDPRLERRVIVEHKSTSEDVSPGSNYWRALHMCGQVSIYFTGARALGHDVVGCVYDVLSKPRLRPYRAGRTRQVDETPDEFFRRCCASITPEGSYQRADVVRLEAEIADALLDDWQTSISINDAEATGRHPRNPDACFRWGRACSYWDVCTGVASLDDPERFRRGEHASPELEFTGGLPILSSSRLKAWRACPRLHRIQYLDQIFPVKTPEPLQVGSLLHKGLEAWWLGTGDGRLGAALSAIGFTK